MFIHHHHHNEHNVTNRGSLLKKKLSCSSTIFTQFVSLFRIRGILVVTNTRTFSLTHSVRHRSQLSEAPLEPERDSVEIFSPLFHSVFF